MYDNTFSSSVNNIFDAVESNKPVEVEKYIMQGRMEEVGEDKQTPLLMALSQRKYDIAGLLIKNGCNLNCKNIIGKTPLHLIVEETTSFWELKFPKKNILDIARLMLKNGAGVNIKDKYGRTPIFYVNESAERIAYEDIVLSAFLENLDLDEMFKENHKPRLFAVTDKKRYNIMGILLKRTKHLEKELDAIAEETMKKRIEEEKENKKFWDLNRMLLTELLVEYGALLDINDIAGKTVFHYAALNKTSEILNLLVNLIPVASSCNHNESANNMFHVVDGCKSPESADNSDSALGLNGRDNNYKTPLYYAIINKKIEGEKAILKTLFGSDVTENLDRQNFFNRDVNGPNPVEILIENDYMEILPEYIDQFGNSIIKKNIEDNLPEGVFYIDWLPPLVLAAEKKKINIIKFLMSKKFSSTHNNRKFFGVLLHVFDAVIDDEVEFEYIIRLFINRLEEQNEIIYFWVNEKYWGNTPLYLSRKKGLKSIEALLVQNGANKEGKILRFKKKKQW